MAVVSDFTDRVSGNISAYRPEDMFNCDETGPFMSTAFRCWDYKDIQASFQEVTSESCCGTNG